MKFAVAGKVAVDDINLTWPDQKQSPEITLKMLHFTLQQLSPAGIQHILQIVNLR
ncbi:hypothetical protein BN133_1218 [Cronobacter dublinensis 582]|nr:hypothetical protein BN133_1218 [Cronobacter dublinensis 582]